MIRLAIKTVQFWKNYKHFTSKSFQFHIIFYCLLERKIINHGQPAGHACVLLPYRSCSLIEWMNEWMNVIPYCTVLYSTVLLYLNQKLKWLMDCLDWLIDWLIALIQLHLIDWWWFDDWLIRFIHSMVDWLIDWGCGHYCYRIMLFKTTHRRLTTLRTVPFFYRTVLPVVRPWFLWGKVL